MAFFGIQIIENGIHLGWQKCLLRPETCKNIPVFTKRKKIEIKKFQKISKFIEFNKYLL